jgi:hypothetical protein
MTTATQSQLKVADEVWIATALLHREHPERPDFLIDDIVERAKKEEFGKNLRPGFYVHVVQHCVANRPPNPGRYRVLYETAPGGQRRLFRKGDTYHPAREGTKVAPEREDLPERYRGLIAWYQDWSQATSRTKREDPLRSMRASGKGLWTGVDPDEYVRQLREGWE